MVLMKTPFPVGSPVLIVGNPSTIYTCAGLFGYVSRVWTPEENQKPDPSYYVTLLRYPTVDGWDAKNDRAKEERGEFNTTTQTCDAADLRPLKNRAALARVARMKASEEAKERAKTPDPVWEAKLAAMSTPEAWAKEKADREAVEAESARIGSVFRLPGRIARGDKSEFPAFRSPEVQAITDERNGYAYRPKGPRDCTVTERARWRQANDTINCASFWSPDADVRALVKELDLDPFADGHETALYKGRGWLFATRADLRREAFKLWNKGAIIETINEAADPDTHFTPRNEGDRAPGFFLHFAYRRTLPIP